MFCCINYFLLKKPTCLADLSNTITSCYDLRWTSIVNL